MKVALITGASRGLGLALARILAANGWGLVIDARGHDALAASARELDHGTPVVAIPGDVADEGHRQALVAAAVELGGLDLLVNNASVLGPSPMLRLAEYPLDELRRVYEVNVLAPIALIQLALPSLTARQGRILNVTSDAAVEGYENWGGYGSSKAALEQASRILSAEHPGLRVWWVDPGDMRTQMHQEAFPGEDISDRPPPEAIAPALVDLIGSDRPSGRYRAAELVVAR